jgi:hypothetical protein
MSSATSSEDEGTDPQDVEIDVELPSPHDNEPAEPPAAPGNEPAEPHVVHMALPAIDHHDWDGMDIDPQTNTSGAAPVEEEESGPPEAEQHSSRRQTAKRRKNLQLQTLPAEGEASEHHSHKTGKPPRTNKAYVEVPQPRPKRVKESFEGRLAPQVCTFPF